MATMADVMNDPMLYMGLGLMSAGARRPANQPTNVGTELMQAMGQYQQMQQAQQRAAMQQAEQSRMQQQFEMEKQILFEKQGQQKTAEERQLAEREAVQKVASDPTMTPRTMAQTLAQLTGDPAYLQQLMKEQKPLEMMNVPRGGVIFDPVTRQPVFTNPMADKADQQKLMSIPEGSTVFDPATRQQVFTNPKTLKQSMIAEPVSLELLPGVPIQTKPLTQKEREGFAATVSSMRMGSDSLDSMIQAARELHDHPGLPRITGTQGLIPDFPGPAKDAEQRREQLKSVIGTSTIQMLKSMSKTGSTGYGNTSDKDREALQNDLASLDRAKTLPEMQTALKQVIRRAEQFKMRAIESVNLKYGAQPGGVPKTPEAPTQRQGDRPGGKVMTQADIQATASASGKSVQEVMEAARQAGFTLR